MECSSNQTGTAERLATGRDRVELENTAWPTDSDLVDSNFFDGVNSETVGK